MLAHARRHPQLTGNLGNIALLKMAGQLGLIPLAMAMSVRDGYREYRRLRHAERLNRAQYACVEPGPLQPYIDATPRLWESVLSGARDDAKEIRMPA